MKIRNLLLAVGLALVSTLASAQATRTWVSGVGDDANPCSRTAPCKTFAGAISKTAAGGEIDALDPGGFGAVTITKSITIDGGSYIAGVLVSGTNGILINAAATDQVILRNLDINGLNVAANSLSGINVLNAKRVVVENVKIYSFTQNGIRFAPTTSSVNALINNVTIAQIGDSGAGLAHAIDIAPAAGSGANVTVSNSHLESNDAGIVVEDAGIATITHSVINDSKNEGVSVKSMGRPTKALIDSTVVTGSKTGVAVESAGATAILTNNLISRNLIGVRRIDNGVMVSFGDNRITDNTGDSTPGLVTVPLR